MQSGWCAITITGHPELHPSSLTIDRSEPPLQKEQVRAALAFALGFLLRVLKAMPTPRVGVGATIARQLVNMSYELSAIGC